MLQRAERTDHPATIRIALIAIATVAVMICATGCGKGDGRNAAPTSTPVAGTLTATAPQAGADTDHTARTANGSALPPGYSAVFDKSDASVSDVSYLEREPGRWEVRTGPAHILYSPADTAHRKYSVSATFEQLDAPSHPEAFGVFIGGQNLDSAKVSYTYFIVRGDGKYMIKVRNGGNTRTVRDWTANPSVPKQDAAGKALYGIRIDVDGATASVSVNGAPITTISGANIPLDGIAGVRINHNLHLIVTPVSVIRGR